MHDPEFQRRLAARILTVVGASCFVAPGACSSTKVSESVASTASTTSGHAESSSSSSSHGSSGSGIAVTGAGGGDDGGADGLDASSDGTGGAATTTRVCLPWPYPYMSDGGAGGSSTGGSGAGGGDAAPPDPGPCPTDFGTVLTLFLGLNCPRGWEPKAIVDGPVVPMSAGACCYDTYLTVCGPGGRPYVHEGDAVLAPVGKKPSGREHSWIEGVRPDVTALAAEARARLADEWTDDALREHASVASFSRASLALLAVGAPAELVERTHQAALDEVRHARLCFALASAYAGRPVVPGAFPIAGTVTLPTTLADVAASAAIEGCLGETIAAVLAAEQLAQATDPAVRAALAAIAEDEARHAELAWETVAWAIREGGEPARAAVEDAFDRGLEGVRRAACEGAGSAASRGLVAHGRLDRATIARVSLEVASSVVKPCASALVRPAA